MSIRRTLFVLVAVLGLVLPTSAQAMKPNPEADPRDPDQDAGYFLGYPSPTYSWHGCTKTSTQDTPTTLDPGVPGIAPGNKQKKVEWTVEESTTATAKYVVKWKVKDGWKICGAQVAMLGSSPDADADYAMQAGYTSKGKKGSTVTSGSETIKVKITKQDCHELGIDKSNAGTFSIVRLYAITVFIKKATKR
jgi:hypothetical protein